MFFNRANAEICPMKWGTILEEDFTLILPITPYRSFPATEIVSNQRVVKSIAGMIADTISLHVMAQSVAEHDDGERKVRIQYYSGPEDTIITGDSVGQIYAFRTFDDVLRCPQLMCRWMLKTENAVECGARCECFKQG
jgi:hypothetical protein